MTNELEKYIKDLDDITKKYNELTDELVKTRELLPVEWLNKQSLWGLVAVVGSPLDVVYYANIYIKELQEECQFLKDEIAGIDL